MLDERPGREAAPAAVLRPPGGYGDGPVFVRVRRAEAGSGFRRAGLTVEINDRRCADDPLHDYVEAENSHNAFVYARLIADRGVPVAALSVVRFARSRPRR